MSSGQIPRYIQIIKVILIIGDFIEENLDVGCNSTHMTYRVWKQCCKEMDTVKQGSYFSLIKKVKSLRVVLDSKLMFISHYTQEL